MSGDRHWVVAPTPMGECIVVAPTASAARYAAWRAMWDAGCCYGGFGRWLKQGGRAWSASAAEVASARDGGRIIERRAA